MEGRGKRSWMRALEHGKRMEEIRLIQEEDKRIRREIMERVEEERKENIRHSPSSAPLAVSIHEAASLLRVDWSAVRTMIRDGRLRAYRGEGRKRGRLWIPWESIMEYRKGQSGI